MKTLKINFQYCYGIKKLEAEFDFSSKRVFAIYAPNGTMKTSFAKSFKDLSRGEQPKDLVFQENQKKFLLLSHITKKILMLIKYQHWL